MRIKKIPRKDIDEYIRIVAGAFPGFGLDNDEKKKKLRARLEKNRSRYKEVENYGLYRNNQLQGGIIHYDFDMTMFSSRVNIGGGGLLAVDLVHKKEHVAKELMLHFLNHYRERGFSMATLYPFRPDFYRKMGFGYGTKHNHYRIRPSDLPASGEKSKVRFLTIDDFGAMTSCYNRLAEKTHGMFLRKDFEKGRFERPGIKFVGIKEGRKLAGYIAFHTRIPNNDNILRIELEIDEIIYETPRDFMNLLSFLRSQADQIHYIHYTTQDEHFHFLPHDPRNQNDCLIYPLAHESNRAGVGIMYRVIDIPALFKALDKHDFNGGNMKMGFDIEDSFIPENGGKFILALDKGRCKYVKKGGADVSISMKIAEFSSMIMGSIDFKSLYDYHLAVISKAEYVEAVNKIFLVDRKPFCTTQF